MNGLIGLIAVLLASSVFVMVMHHRLQMVRGSGTVPRFAIWAICFVLVVSSLAVYGWLGRFSDWQTRKIDQTVDFQRAAKITEARRLVKQSPENTEHRVALAQALIDGALYAEAIETLQETISVFGESARLLGLQVHAMYYRDHRAITDKTRKLIDRALALDPLEIQTRMLLGQDAFVNKRYEEAISHWQMLLDASAAPERERALRNAIVNARQHLTREVNN